MISVEVDPGEVGGDNSGTRFSVSLTRIYQKSLNLIRLGLLESGSIWYCT